MDKIKHVIRILSKHNFRSVSNVVGEYVEKQIATMLDGTQASHCNKGFDVLCKDLGRVEVKSRNAYAKSMRCTLPDHKLATLDNFILAIVKDGEIEKLLLFNKKLLLSIKASSGVVYIDKRHFDRAKDITTILTQPQINT